MVTFFNKKERKRERMFCMCASVKSTGGIVRREQREMEEPPTRKGTRAVVSCSPPLDGT